VSDEPKRDATFERVDAQRLAVSNTTWAFLASALLFPLIAPIGSLLGAASGVAVATLGWLALFVGFAIYGATKKAFGLVAKDAHVEVATAGVKIDGKLVAKDKLDNAAVVRDPNLDSYRVMLGGKRSMGRKLLLLTKDEATARSIVAKLGLDASRSTATWTVLSGLMHSRAAAFGTFAPVPLAILLLLIGAFTSSAAVAISRTPAFA
jgi:hypothetical protein